MAVYNDDRNETKKKIHRAQVTHRHKPPNNEPSSRTFVRNVVSFCLILLMRRSEKNKYKKNAMVLMK